jgi:DNA repair protein SbcC/Rad50
MTYESLTCESIEATQTAIETVLGFNRPLFRASSLLVQGDSGSSFANASPADRKAILFNALAMYIYDLLLAQAEQERKVVQAELERLAGGIEQLEADLAARTDVEQQLTEATKHEERASEALTSAEKTLAAATEKLQAARQAQAAYGAAQETAESKRLLVEGAQGRLEVLADQQARARAELAAKPALEEKAGQVDVLAVRCDEIRAQLTAYREAQTERTRALNEQTRLRTEITDRERQLDKLLDGKQRDREAAAAMAAQADATCQTCGQPVADEAKQRAVTALLDAAEQKGRDTDALHATIETARRQLAEIEIVSNAEPPAPPEPIGNAEADLRDAQHARENLAALTEREHQLDENTAETARITEALPKLERDHADAKARVERMAVEIIDVALLTAGEAGARKLVEDARRSLADATEARTWLARDRERLTTLAAQLDQQKASQQAAHARLDLLLRLEKALGRNGVPALVLENIMPLFEEEAQQTLARLGGKTAGATIELRTQRETKKGGLSDGLWVVVVTPEGAEREIGRWSGGERMRITIALREGLRALALNRRAAASAFAAFDEPENLDTEGKQAFREWVQYAYEQGLQRVYLMSQDPELRDTVERTLELVAAEGEPSRVVTAGVLEGAAA